MFQLLLSHNLLNCMSLMMAQSEPKHVRESLMQNDKVYVCVCVCVCLYIYIYIENLTNVVC